MKEEKSIEPVTSLFSYLSFRLGEETFAVNVGQVLEILEIPLITKVPHSPEYMRGVMNLRGNVLPIIDTRLKFGMSRTEITIHTCIVVFSLQIGQPEPLFLGALVDSVQEVLEISASHIQPSPSIGNRYKSEFIQGMVKVEEQFIMILHPDRVFSAEELAMVIDTSGEAVI